MEKKKLALLFVGAILLTAATGTIASANGVHGQEKIFGDYKIEFSTDPADPVALAETKIELHIENTKTEGPITGLEVMVHIEAPREHEHSHHHLAAAPDGDHEHDNQDNAAAEVAREHEPGHYEVHHTFTQAGEHEVRVEFEEIEATFNVSVLSSTPVQTPGLIEEMSRIVGWLAAASAAVLAVAYVVLRGIKFG